MGWRGGCFNGKNMNYVIYIDIALVATVLILCLSLRFRHYPGYRLNEIQLERIKKYGLVHFTYSDRAEKIIDEGLIPGKEKPMYRRERDMVWMFIADPQKFEENLKDVHSKGPRKDYDTAVFIKELSDEQLGKLRCRRDKEYVTYRGCLKTSDMKLVRLNNDLENKED